MHISTKELCMASGSRLAAATAVPCLTGCLCREDCDSRMQEFLKRVSYVQGQYDENESYQHLNEQLVVEVRLPTLMIHW